MSATVVQQTNPHHYPQMSTMNHGEGVGRQQRPTHNSSKLLTDHEHRLLFEILGSNCVVNIIEISSKNSFTFI